MKNILEKLDIKLVEKILVRENKFLNELFAVVPVPSHNQDEEGKQHSKYFHN